MDKVSDMIKDAQTLRDRYEAMLILIENDEYDLAAGMTKDEMITQVKAAIVPLNDFLALYAVKN